jgi:hypothetical protein
MIQSHHLILELAATDNLAYRSILVSHSFIQQQGKKKNKTF